MGMDVSMIGGHALSDDLFSIATEVPRLLSSSYHDEELAQRTRTIIRPESFREWSPNSWRLDLAGLPSLEAAVRTDNCIAFDGPLGLHMRVGLFTFEMHNHFRWWQFLEDEDVRERLLKLMRHVAGMLGGKEFMVVPDNATPTSGFAEWIMKPATFPEIVAGMRQKIGPPCSGAKEMASLFEANPDYDGYLLFSGSPVPAG